MLVRLTYIFETDGGFRYEREDPKEIMDIVRANYKALKELVGGDGEYADWYIDETDPLMPRGIITTHLDGLWKVYKLSTTMTPVNEENPRT